jgi:ATP-dependent Clp protease protease subunit
MKDELNALLAEMTGQKVDKVENDTERDYFMSAAEAKEYGLIDAIVTRKTTSGGAA